MTLDVRSDSISVESTETFSRQGQTVAYKELSMRDVLLVERKTLP